MPSTSYCQIPFAKTVAKNPLVQALADHLGRTPASVARKLGNFGSFDPRLAERNVVGLGNTSKTDREIWDRYTKDWSFRVAWAARPRQSPHPMGILPCRSA